MYLPNLAWKCYIHISVKYGCSAVQHHVQCSQLCRFIFHTGQITYTCKQNLNLSDHSATKRQAMSPTPDRRSSARSVSQTKGGKTSSFDLHYHTSYSNSNNWSHFETEQHTHPWTFPWKCWHAHIHSWRCSQSQSQNNTVTLYRPEEEDDRGWGKKRQLYICGYQLRKLWVAPVVFHIVQVVVKIDHFPLGTRSQKFRGSSLRFFFRCAFAETCTAKFDSRILTPAQSLNSNGYETDKEMHLTSFR